MATATQPDKDGFYTDKNGVSRQKTQYGDYEVHDGREYSKGGFGTPLSKTPVNMSQKTKQTFADPGDSVKSDPKTYAAYKNRVTNIGKQQSFDHTYIEGDSIPAYKKGGPVKKTGLAYVHKGEMVLTAAQTKGAKARALNKKKNQNSLQPKKDEWLDNYTTYNNNNLIRQITK